MIQLQNEQCKLIDGYNLCIEDLEVEMIENWIFPALNVVICTALAWTDHQDRLNKNQYKPPDRLSRDHIALMW